ncbi:MAG: glycosyltransferase family 87 protein [Sphingomicrobium sp.]
MGSAIRDGGWLTRARILRIAAISGVIGAGMLAFMWLSRAGSVDRFGSPVGADFTAFWHAGRIALNGSPQAAWDLRSLNAAVHASHGVDYVTAWLYPPVFLLVAAPLAVLPYLGSLLAWQALSLVALGSTLQAIFGKWTRTLVALASPLTPIVLAHGQNSFLTAALLGAGLLALEARPLAGGAAFGMLVYKPQLALVLGPLLLVRRQWSALAVAALTAIGLVALSYTMFGAESWAAFVESLAGSRRYMEQGAVGLHKSASLFAAVRLWGGGIDAAYFVQALGAIGALALIWRTRSAGADVVAAAACAAAALSTPYLLDYDMAVVGIGAAFLFRASLRTGFRDFEGSALAFIWGAPWFSRPAAEYLLLPLGPVAMLLLAWLAWRRIPPEGTDTGG